jgi:hypothetical protein
MDQTLRTSNNEIDRRSFVKKGLSAVGAATTGLGALSSGSYLLAEDQGEHSESLTRGDAALLRFAAAAEILETDFWVQYNELCGIPTARSRVDLETRPSLQRSQSLMPTWLNTSMTTLMTSLHIRIS